MRKVLVLNKSWIPIDIVILEKALIKVFSDKAKIIDSKFNSYFWQEWVKLDPGNDYIRAIQFNLYNNLLKIINKSSF